MISRWEAGKAEPSMEYARILAKYFNVSLDYLGSSNLMVVQK
jgi:transcriptional regulator with XRE-family HTH domain